MAGEGEAHFVPSVGVGPSEHLGELELKKVGVEHRLFAYYSFSVALVHVTKRGLPDCHSERDARNQMERELVKVRAYRNPRHQMEQQGSRSMTAPVFCLPSLGKR